MSFFKSYFKYWSVFSNWVVRRWPQTATPIPVGTVREIFTGRLRTPAEFPGAERGRQVQRRVAAVNRQAPDSENGGWQCQLPSPRKTGRKIIPMRNAFAPRWRGIPGG